MGGIGVFIGRASGISRLATIPATPGSPPRPRQPEVLPFGEQATTVAVSTSGRLVYSAEFRDTTLYAVQLTEPLKRPHALAAFSSTYDEHTPHFSPDGARLAFASTRSGSEEIWVANVDGSHPLQMTSMGGPQCANPQWSPDGRTILFNSRREGSADLYLLQPDTGALRRLTTGPSEEGEARWSRDGQSIYFGSIRAARFRSGGCPPREALQRRSRGSAAWQRLKQVTGFCITRRTSGGRARSGACRSPEATKRRSPTG